MGLTVRTLCCRKVFPQLGHNNLVSHIRCTLIYIMVSTIRIPLSYRQELFLWSNSLNLLCFEIFRYNAIGMPNLGKDFNSPFLFYSCVVSIVCNEWEVLNCPIKYCGIRRHWEIKVDTYCLSQVDYSPYISGRLFK